MHWNECLFGNKELNWNQNEEKRMGGMPKIDVEAEAPILGPPHAKSWLIWKDLDAGKDRGQEEKGMTEDEMVGWDHWLDGHRFAWTPGVPDGQGGPVCCGSWGHKESDSTERLNWTSHGWLYQVNKMWGWGGIKVKYILCLK